jgi:hypothetical protein
MPRKRMPPKEPVDAVLEDTQTVRPHQPDITTVAASCSRCGQGLPTLLRIPRASFVSPPPVVNASDLYLESGELGGWTWDGNTLRPTRYHLERQQRAREEVRTQPPTKTKSTRQRLARHTQEFAGSYFSRPLGRGGTLRRQTGAGPSVDPAPEQFECPQCHAMVRVAVPLAAHDDVM